MKKAGKGMEVVIWEDVEHSFYLNKITKGGCAWWRPRCGHPRCQWRCAACISRWICMIGSYWCQDQSRGGWRRTYHDWAHSQDGSGVGGERQEGHAWREDIREVGVIVGVEKIVGERKAISTVLWVWVGEGEKGRRVSADVAQSLKCA